MIIIITSSSISENYGSRTNTCPWSGIWEQLVSVSPEILPQSWHCVDLRWMRRESGPEWTLLQLSWPEAMWSGSGWGSETSPWTWKRGWITVQVFIEHLPCPGKRQPDSSVLALEFKWLGFHPGLSLTICMIWAILFTMGLRFLSIKWCQWQYCFCVLEGRVFGKL